jgi:Protein of unknown function (DUF3300)
MKMFKIAGVVIMSAALTAAQEPPVQLPPQTAAPPPSYTPQPMAPAPGQQPTAVLNAAQIDDLVAPIALYPDSLLSQVLVASTYPLELVEAQQWLLQNQNLQGPALLDAAHQQNWDPSVQAMVAFPDVLARLTENVQWTTALGNAFLAQQAEVMSAVQQMRAKAGQNGKLQSNSYDTVTTQTQDGQSAIVIQPTNPQVVYVPTYDPTYIWGPPVYGYYPPLWYPAIGVGFGWGPGIYINGFFGGCCGWGAFGWGWSPFWFGHQIYVNNYFLHRYGFADFHAGFAPTGVWVHNPDHRLGVAYPNRALADRFRGGEVRGAPAARNFNAAPERQENRGFSSGGGARFGSSGFERQNSGGAHSAFGGIRGGGEQRIQSDHGFASMGHAGGGSRGGGRR